MLSTSQAVMGSCSLIGSVVSTSGLFLLASGRKSFSETPKLGFPYVAVVEPSSRTLFILKLTLDRSGLAFKTTLIPSLSSMSLIHSLFSFKR